MSRAVVLDAEAFSALGAPTTPSFAEAQAAFEAADRSQQAAVVPAVILAELYRGPCRNRLIDACLSRETGIGVRDTDRSLARLVGGVLALAEAGAEDLADAHNVAVAVEAGGGVVITGDASDLERLAAPYPNVAVFGV